ncbi:hypothetical protein [Methylomonas koyamae]|nr:hypothetical protein [Methylomonas koyamae]
MTLFNRASLKKLINLLAGNDARYKNLKAPPGCGAIAQARRNEFY